MNPRLEDAINEIPALLAVRACNSAMSVGITPTELAGVTNWMRNYRRRTVLLNHKRG